ncbi:MAG: GTPase HflX [Filifactor alocis]|nr:GTPase HflX [Filifactor alocis]
METTQNKLEYRAILVGSDFGSSNRIYARFEDVMKELEELAQAAEVEVVGILTQARESIDVRYYIGKGKVEELKDFVETMEANLVIFQNELSGSQLRNLEEALGTTVIDRTMLILDIFAKRASTAEGKLQVELAQLKYKMPRLIHGSSHLSRTGAGIGSRGPGEKKLETDKRRIRRKIFEIEQELKAVRQNRDVQRKSRIKNQIPIVALAGYTNAGKSTLCNRLMREHQDYSADKEVFVKDMLFATLDTALRKAKLPNGNEFLLTDTVGFVSELPHDLVNAFHSTLEEVTYADLILHVVDVSNEKYDLQINTTEQVFEKLGATNIPTVTVFNKIDLASDDFVISKANNKIAVSAKTGYHIEELLQKIQDVISNNIEVDLLIPYDKGSILNVLHNKYNIMDESYEEGGTRIKLLIDDIDYEKYKDYLLKY